MPYGYVFEVLFIGAATALSWRPIRRSGLAATVSFQAAVVLNEAPIIGIAALAASTGIAWSQDSLHGAALIFVGLAGVIAVGLLVLLIRGLRDASAILNSLAAGLKEPLAPLPPLATLRRALLPIARRRLSVKRVGNLAYGPDRGRNILDVYRSRTPPTAAAPVFIHFHGGRFRHGRKNSQALSLLYYLASRGWVCISANYRLQPHVTYLEQVADVELVLDWVEASASDWAIDPSRIVLSGTSAGAHLAAYVGLDPARQISAVVGLGGYYGPVDALGSSPKERIGPGSPPVLILHGEDDTLVPISYVRQFATAFDAGAPDRLVFADLPRTQHAFDLWDSPRFAAVTAGIETFLTQVTTPTVTRR